jgi:hypothetical protein
VSDWLKLAGKPQETSSKQDVSTAAGGEIKVVAGGASRKGLALLNGSMEWKVNVTEGHVLLNKLITE